MEDDLGDRMKLYEGMEAGRRLMPRLPCVARIDGRSFSTFARDLAKPYDPRLSRLMIETTRHLVRESNAHAWVEIYFTGFGWLPFWRTSRSVIPGQRKAGLHNEAGLLIGVIPTDDSTFIPAYRCLSDRHPGSPPRSWVHDRNGSHQKHSHTGELT